MLVKLESFSENGKIKNNLENDEEITVYYIMNKTIHVSSGSFMYKGQKTTVMITVYQNSLDNADLDEVISACRIKISH